MESICPFKDRISALSNYPKPQTVKELQSFLGAVKFCRQYITKIEIILSPLNNLLKKLKLKSSSLRVKWNKDAETVFINIKTSITNTMILGFPSKTDIYDI